MKKKLSIVVAIILLGFNSINADTIFIENIDVENLYGFGFNISGVDLLDQFTLTMGPALVEGWQVFKVTMPAIGVQGLQMTGTEPLGKDIVLEIQSSSEISLSDFILADIMGDDLNAFRNAYQVLQHGDVYSFKSVPIPSAVYLFSVSILSLLGIRRKIQK